VVVCSGDGFGQIHSAQASRVRYVMLKSAHLKNSLSTVESFTLAIRKGTSSKESTIFLPVKGVIMLDSLKGTLETILVVDDTEIVRTAVAALLVNANLRHRISGKDGRADSPSPK
jgi:hypothetical protein